jgi:hypothetical protein
MSLQAWRCDGAQSAGSEEAPDLPYQKERTAWVALHSLRLLRPLLLLCARHPQTQPMARELVQALVP